MRLAADANVLLSAVLGGRAKDILLHHDVEEIVTAEATFRELAQNGAPRAAVDSAEVLSFMAARKGAPLCAFQEVQEHASQLAHKKRLSVDVVLLSVAALPVRVVEREDYAATVPQAEKRIGQRDPDDVDLLALAIQLKIPVWSNDNDFKDAGVEWYTTAALLKRLGISE